MLIKELETLKTASELVSLYLYGDDEPLTGLIHTANSRVTAMVLFNDNGEYEGWTLFETANITGMTWGDREHRAIAKLVDISFERVLPLKGKMSFAQSLIELGSRLECVALYTQENESEDDFDMVRVVDFDGHWLKVHTYGSKQTLSRGWKMIPREDVIRIEVDTPYMNRMLLLHKEPPLHKDELS